MSIHSRRSLRSGRIRYEEVKNMSIYSRRAPSSGRKGYKSSQKANEEIFKYPTKLYEEIYTDLYINSNLFRVEEPEKILDIIDNYKSSESFLVIPIEIYAKKVFNEIMHTKFKEKDIEIEVLYLLHFINYGT